LIERRSSITQSHSIYSHDKAVCGLIEHQLVFKISIKNTISTCVYPNLEVIFQVIVWDKLSKCRTILPCRSIITLYVNFGIKLVIFF